MGTVLNVGKIARKGYKIAKGKYTEAVRENIQGDISIYYVDKLEDAKHEIGKALGNNLSVQSLLDKNSEVKKDYSNMNNELMRMHNKIEKLSL